MQPELAASAKTPSTPPSFGQPLPGIPGLCLPLLTTKPSSVVPSTHRKLSPLDWRSLHDELAKLGIPAKTARG